MMVSASPEERQLACGPSNVKVWQLESTEDEGSSGYREVYICTMIV